MCQAIKRQFGHSGVPSAPTGQRGAALLLLLLLLVVGSAYLMVSRLEVNTSAADRARHDAQVLAQAKDALIGYAVKDTNRPGEMPCPDFNDDGQIDITIDYSGTNCKTLVGWLPWKTLGLPDLRDSSGSRLWYALSDPFHANGTAKLNSATLGQLTIGGTTTMNNVVAIVIAPGASLGSQLRPSTDATGLANYLEGTNKNASPNTNFETRVASSTFNDVLLPITHDELFSVVDKRILKEIAQSFEAYRADPDHDPATNVTAYPWLSPYANPTSAVFEGVAGTMQGQLPVTAPGATFTTDFSVVWNIDDGAVTTVNGFPVDCVKHSSCNWAPGVPVTAPAVPKSQSNCIWTTKDEVDCSGSAMTTTGTGTTLTYGYYVTCRSSGAGNNACTGTSTINNPSQTSLRTRDWSSTGAVKVTIVILATTGAGPAQSGILQVNSTTTGTISVKNIRYDLDTNTNELPAWVVTQDWHHLIFAAYAPGEPFPGSTVPCTAGTNCLSLKSSDGSVANNVRALIVLGGPQLAGQDRSVASAGLSDYFEGENATPGDQLFETKPESSTFNDKVEVISTSP